MGRTCLGHGTHNLRHISKPPFHLRRQVGPRPRVPQQLPQSEGPGWASQLLRADRRAPPQPGPTEGFLSAPDAKPHSGKRGSSVQAVPAQRTSQDRLPRGRAGRRAALLLFRFRFGWALPFLLHRTAQPLALRVPMGIQRLSRPLPLVVKVVCAPNRALSADRGWPPRASQATTSAPPDWPIHNVMGLSSPAPTKAIPPTLVP